MDYRKALEKFKFNTAVAKALYELAHGPIGGVSIKEKKLQVEVFLRDNDAAISEMVTIGRLLNILLVPELDNHPQRDQPFTEGEITPFSSLVRPFGDSDDPH